MTTPTFPPFTKTFRATAYPAIDPTQEKLSCKGLTVAITGSGSGIGKAIALSFAKAKASKIALLGRTQSTLDETAEGIAKISNDVKTLAVTTDIVDEDSVQSAFTKISKEFGGAPDIIVNCAGGNFAMGPVESISMPDFRKTYELNVFGTTNVFQKFIQSTQVSEGEKRKKRTIVNVASGAAHVPYMPTAVCYASSKLASTKIAEYVHFEHRDWRVFNLQPGVIATALAAKNNGRKGETEPEVPGNFCVWLARDPRAEKLNGRFVWANWDVDELLDIIDEKKDNALLFTGIKGWAEGYDADQLLERLNKVTGRG